MKKSEKPASNGTSLDDSIQLAIRDEVEKRVEQRENIYWKFGGLFVVVVALFFTFLWKVSVSEIRETVEKQLAEKEVVKARDRIMEIKSSAETVNQNINTAAAAVSNILTSVADNQQVFTNRLNEIKQQDNVLLEDDFQKLFVSQTISNFVDGNKIILDYEPIPQTVRLTFPQAQLHYEFNFMGRVEGKALILNSIGVANFSTLVTNTASRLEVKYIRKSLR